MPLAVRVDAVYAVSGSTNAINSITSLIAHERTNSEISYPYDYTYRDMFQFSANGVSPERQPGCWAPAGTLMIAGGSDGDYLLAVYAEVSAR